MLALKEQFLKSLQSIGLGIWATPELELWGLISQVYVLKVRMFLREKLQVLSSLSVASHHTRDGVYVQIVFQPLLSTSVCFFSFSQCVVITQQTFRVFKRKISICSSRLCEFAKGGEFRMFLHCHLELEILGFFFFLNSWDAHTDFTIFFSFIH